MYFFFNPFPKKSTDAYTYSEMTQLFFIKENYEWKSFMSKPFPARIDQNGGIVAAIDPANPNTPSVSHVSGKKKLSELITEMRKRIESESLDSFTRTINTLKKHLDNEKQSFLIGTQSPLDLAAFISPDEFNKETAALSSFGPRHSSTPTESPAELPLGGFRKSDMMIHSAKTTKSMHALSPSDQSVDHVLLSVKGDADIKIPHDGRTYHVFVDQKGRSFESVLSTVTCPTGTKVSIVFNVDTFIGNGDEAFFVGPGKILTWVNAGEWKLILKSSPPKEEDLTPISEFTNGGLVPRHGHCSHRRVNTFEDIDVSLISGYEYLWVSFHQSHLYHDGVRALCVTPGETYGFRQADNGRWQIIDMKRTMTLEWTPKESLEEALSRHENCGVVCVLTKNIKAIRASNTVVMKNRGFWLDAGSRVYLRLKEGHWKEVEASLNPPQLFQPKRPSLETVRSWGEENRDYFNVWAHKDKPVGLFNRDGWLESQIKKSIARYQTEPEVTGSVSFNGSMTTNEVNQPKGETKMYNSPIDLKIIAKVAGKGTKDEFSSLIESGLTENDSELAVALREAENMERKENIRNAVSHIQTLMKDAQVLLTSDVNTVRQARATEKQMLKRIHAVERARHFGAETMNFLPLAYLLYPNVAEKHEVPEDWVPKAKQEKAE